MPKMTLSSLLTQNVLHYILLHYITLQCFISCCIALWLHLCCMPSHFCYMPSMSYFTQSHLNQFQPHQICIQSFIFDVFCLHWVKRVHIRCFSGPYFPTFGPNSYMRIISPYSFRMRENTNQKNSQYEDFLRSTNFSHVQSDQLIQSDRVLHLALNLL